MSDLLTVVKEVAKRSLSKNELLKVKNMQKIVDTSQHYIDENAKLKAIIKELQDEISQYENDIEDGILLYQGHIPGTYNGHVCAECSHYEAKFDCIKCLKYYCIDHIDTNSMLCYNHSEQDYSDNELEGISSDDEFNDE